MEILTRFKCKVSHNTRHNRPQGHLNNHKSFAFHLNCSQYSSNAENKTEKYSLQLITFIQKRDCSNKVI